MQVKRIRLESQKKQHKKWKIHVRPIPNSRIYLQSGCRIECDKAEIIRIEEDTIMSCVNEPRLNRKSRPRQYGKSVTKCGVTTCVTKVGSSNYLEGLPQPSSHQRTKRSLFDFTHIKIIKINLTPRTITATIHRKTDVEPPPATSEFWYNKNIQCKLM